MSLLPVVAIWGPLLSSHPWPLHFALSRHTGNCIMPARGSASRLKCGLFVGCMQYVTMFPVPVGIHPTMQVAYNRTLETQFRIAYDVYLEILRHVNARVDVALGRDTTHWKLLNVCAPCMYKIEGEPHLKHSMLVAMDGNQSLKLVDGAFRAGKALHDDRIGHSECWLTPAEVDRWKDEVNRPVCFRYISMHID